MPARRDYSVSLTGAPPVFDSLPVAKITDYPLEKRDYKPFAQAILCVGGPDLYLRMWAFEVSPMPTSALQCVLYPFPESPDLAFWLSLEHGGGDTVAVSANLLERGGEKPLTPAQKTALSDGVTCRPHNGEDLQGVYWGMTVSVPLSVLELLGGPHALRPGGAFPGNFYKTCADSRFAHKGSWFPADFAADPFARSACGTFRAIAY